MRKRSLSNVYDVDSNSKADTDSHEWKNSKPQLVSGFMLENFDEKVIEFEVLMCFYLRWMDSRQFQLPVEKTEIHCSLSLDTLNT